MGLINQTLHAEIARELQPEDRALLATSKVGSSTPHLKRIRAVHHAAARLMATGMKDQEVSMNVGLCPSRLSILKNDPAFKDLILFYAQGEQDRFGAVQDRMAMLGLTAAEELSARIEEQAEELTAKDLIEITKVALDRGGYAPVTKTESKNLHAHLGIDDILKIKAETQNDQSGQVFRRAPAKTLQASAGSKESPADNSGTVCGTEETQGLTIEGLGL